MYAEDKLSQSVPLSILLDRRGFLWVGTQDGLNRYDGYHFKKYKHELFDPTSISGNCIVALHEDREGYLWIGTRSAGLNRYDWRSESFIYFRHDPGVDTSLSHNSINTVMEDRDGFLWVGTAGGGLNRLDKQRKHFTVFRHSSSNARGLGHDTVCCLLQDHLGVIWVGTDGGGLNRFNPESETFKRYLHDPAVPSGLSGNSVYSIFEDSSNRLWVGTVSGLNRFRRDSGTFLRYLRPNGKEETLIDPTVSSIIEVQKDHLWLGSGTSDIVGRGIGFVDTKNMTFSRYNHSGADASRLNRSSIMSLYKDPFGVVWVGTYGSGVYKYDPGKNKFGHYKQEKNASNTLSRSEVWSIHEDRDGNLWIGTLYGGLNFMDSKTSQFSHFFHDPDNPHSLGDNSVRAILEDRRGDIWVGLQQGLDRLDKKTRRFTHFRRDGAPGSLNFDRISCLMEDREGHIWAGTWGGGVNCWDPGTREFKHYRDCGGKGVLGKRVTCLLQDRTGDIWIGTASNGMNRLRIGEDKQGCLHYMNQPGQLDCLSHNYVMSVYEEPHGTMWIGTCGGGLNRFDRKNNKFTYLTTKDGLPNDCIYAILGDDTGNLWLSTNNGLCKYSPYTRSFTVYTEADGLQSNEFNQGAYHKGHSGTLYFGGIEGFNCFDPKRIQLNSQVPTVVVTDFKVFGAPVPPGPGRPFRYIDSNTSAVALSYAQNHFSFEFSALSFSSPRNNRYAYKLDGFDDDWIYCGRRRYINYTNLDGGSYVLRIKGANSDGTWNEKGVTVNIEITPPFWKNWWFRILAIGLLAFGTAYHFTQRTKKYKEKIAYQQAVQHRLRKSKLELQKAKELVELRHAEIMKLVNAISSVLVAVDHEKKIYQWNGPAAVFFQIPKEQCLGEQVDGVLAGVLHPRDMELIFDTQLTAEANALEKELEVTVRGHQFLLQVIVSPILDKKGNKRGLLLLGEDITNRKAQEAQQNLVMKLKCAGEMCAGILHEINTPVQYIAINNRIISQSLQSLENGAGQEESGNNTQPPALRSANQAVEIIRDGVEKVMTVSRAMREFFYPGNAGKELCDINKLLKSAVLAATYKVKDSAAVEIQFEEKELLTYGRPADLILVFLNLIFNAADAVEETGKRGFIKICGFKKDRDIVVEIQDSGAGIEPGVGEKVFEPFFTTKSLGKGTGQGLAIAQRVIREKHGGQLSFRSPPEGGTVFVVVLPITDAGV